MRDVVVFHAAGDWPEGRVRSVAAPDGRERRPEIEALIDAAWAQTLARPGVHLFDGPMCRMERWNVTPAELRVELSRTSYKAFLGTNLSHPELADRYGRQVLANPVGVSPALITADGFLMMGRRNDSVAYYPRRVHPFAGALDPADPDVFAAIRRELREELHLTDVDVPDVRCTGVAEDVSIRQPELIFMARTTLTRAAVEARMADEEHDGVWATRWTPEAIERAVTAALAGEGEAFTPVAMAAMVLGGRVTFGLEWARRWVTSLPAT